MHLDKIKLTKPIFSADLKKKSTRPLNYEQKLNKVVQELTDIQKHKSLLNAIFIDPESSVQSYQEPWSLLWYHIGIYIQHFRSGITRLDAKSIDFQKISPTSLKSMLLF